MNCKLFLISIFFGYAYATGKFDIPTRNEDVPETSTDITGRSIEKFSSQLKTNDEADLEISTSWEDITLDEGSNNQTEIENVTNVEETISAAITNDRNNSGTETEIVLDMNAINVINLETTTGRAEITSEVNTGTQSETEITANGSIIPAVEEIATEVTRNAQNIPNTATDLVEVLQFQTPDQSNLEPTNTTISPIGEAQPGGNLTVSIIPETSTTMAKIASQVTTNPQNISNTATATREFLFKMNTKEQNDLKTATDTTIPPTTSSPTSETSTTVEEVASQVTINSQNIPNTTAGIGHDFLAKNTLNQTATRTNSLAEKIELELTTNTNKNSETTIGVEETTRPPTPGTQNSSESATGQTTELIGKTLSKMQNFNQKTDTETFIALKEIESVDSSDDEDDLETVADTLPVWSQRESDNRTDLKIITESRNKWRSAKYENEKIERRIADALNVFSSNCNIYKPIKFSLEHFEPPSAHRIRIGPKTDARVFGFSLEETRDRNMHRGSYSTVINCESDAMKIQASIPHKLKIKAEIELLAPHSKNRILSRGSIEVLYTGVQIWGYFDRDEKYLGPRGHSSIQELFPNMNFDNSAVHFNGIDMEHQVQLYYAVEKLFKRTKQVQDFFIRELKRQMHKNGISYSSSCSNVINPAQNDKHSISISDENLKQSYVIAEVKFEPFKHAVFHVEPIVVDGLLNFSSSQFIRVKYDTNPAEANNYQRQDEAKDKVFKRIVAKDLKGQFRWIHHSKTNVLPFDIDQVEFESIFSNRIHRQGRKVNEKKWKIPKINVVIGKIKIGAASHVKFCENENNFANSILSNYLEMLIGNSLQNSIKKIFNSGYLREKCDVFGH